MIVACATSLPHLPNVIGLTGSTSTLHMTVGAVPQVDLNAIVIKHVTISGDLLARCGYASTRT